ncbi:MAG: GTPase HflX [Fibrobacter sp.]|nr:GTPase HflX [Fibrobacter sp.]
MIENKVHTEKIVLAGLLLSSVDSKLFEEDMQEMRMLCETAGAFVISTIIQRRESPVASTFLGMGKLEEIKRTMKESSAKTLVIDAQLSPGQIRNIEKIVDGKVIDRGQLILDIFAKHARTNEARIQVELAQMKLLYPRLTHAWTHFSQQVGGIGTVGPGEKQLEVDRRLVKNKISDLNDKLKKIEKNRVTQKKGRNNIFQAVLVGYTNVGKSSLLNAISGSDVFVENKLFATLDTSTRRTFLPGAGNIIISDTVGFLRKLPHQLVASFRSTLSVVSDANLLLIVVDGSSEWVGQQLKTVHTVLDELKAGEIPSLLVFNKMDLVTDVFVKKQLMLEYPDALFVSTFNKDDIAQFKAQIASNVIEFEKNKKISEIIHRETKKTVPDED